MGAFKGKQVWRDPWGTLSQKERIYLWDAHPSSALHLQNCGQDEPSFWGNASLVFCDGSRRDGEAAHHNHFGTSPWGTTPHNQGTVSRWDLLSAAWRPQHPLPITPSAPQASALRMCGLPSRG